MNSLTASFTARIYATRRDAIPLRHRSIHQFINRRVTVLPTRTTLTSTRFVCMAEPYLLLKLESAEKTWKELSVKLADPDIVSNPSEYQKIAQSVSELDV
ncbi:peptide chain release factor 1-like protein, partial [Trifolium pratense]